MKSTAVFLALLFFASNAFSQTIINCNKDQKAVLQSTKFPTEEGTCDGTPITGPIQKEEYVFFREGAPEIFSFVRNNGNIDDEYIIPCSALKSGLYYMESRITYSDGRISPWCNAATWEGCLVCPGNPPKWKVRIRPESPGGAIKPLPPGGTIEPR